MQPAIQQIQRYSAAEENIPLSWSIDRTPNPNYLYDIINNNTRNYRVSNINSLLPNISVGYLLQPNIYNEYHDSNFIVISHPENRRDPTIPVINVIMDTTLEVKDEEKNCCICFEHKEKSEICKLICNHSFCGDCLDNTIETFKSRNLVSCCPLCRDKISIITVQTDVNKELFSKHT